MSEAIVLTNAEAERQDIVDNAIMELIEQLNPGAPLEWDIEDVATVRAEICAILVKKGRCTEHEFYPYLEINREEDDPKPFLTYQDVAVWICCDDDEMESAFWYTTNLSNSNTDFDEGDGTQFDVRDIPHPDDIPAAVTWTVRKFDEFNGSSSEDTAGREAHAAIIRYAIEQGYLTQDGFNLPDEG